MWTATNDSKNVIFRYMISPMGMYLSVLSIGDVAIPEVLSRRISSESANAADWAMSCRLAESVIRNAVAAFCSRQICEE